MSIDLQKKNKTEKKIIKIRIQIKFSKEKKRREIYKKKMQEFIESIDFRNVKNLLCDAFFHFEILALSLRDYAFIPQKPK